MNEDYQLFRWFFVLVVLVGLSTLAFVGWVIVQLLQHNGVI